MFSFTGSKWQVLSPLCNVSGEEFEENTEKKNASKTLDQLSGRFWEHRGCNKKTKNSFPNIFPLISSLQPGCHFNSSGKPALVTKLLLCNTKNGF